MMRQVLKYPGSKWNIASNLISLIPEHHSYVEPFFGSGAVLFSKEPSNIETINDIDSDVTNLFHCIQTDSERLARMVMTTPYSREIYENQYEQPTDVTADEYQKATNFLIKCWQSHGFRVNEYKVGWKSDVQGREKAYSMWNWYRLPEWIIEIAERLRMVQIENRPAVDLIERYNNTNTFMYIDPPYLMNLRTGPQYKHEMTEKEHQELLTLLNASKAKIMISGYSSDLYDSILTKWQKKTFSSCAQYGKPRIETIWMNYETEPEQIQMDIKMM